MLESQGPFSQSPQWAPSGGASAGARFGHPNYLVRRKFLELFGGSFFVYDPSGQLVLFSKMKAFKLKEDIRIYADEAMSQEILLIKARQILDFGATYDVTDAATGQKIGALRRKGLKSMLQDEWAFLDAADREMGILKEESTLLALLRRFVEWVAFFLPQQYNGSIGGRPVCVFKQTRNPFTMKLLVDFSPDTSGLLDRRLGLAAAILLCAIEGRQG